MITLISSFCFLLKSCAMITLLDGAPESCIFFLKFWKTFQFLFSGWSTVVSSYLLLPYKAWLLFMNYEKKKCRITMELVCQNDGTNTTSTANLNKTTLSIQYLYVWFQLFVQNQTRKWNFPLNFWNGINWASTFSKAFGSSEALTLVLSKNTCLYDNNSNSKCCTLY